MAASDTKTYSLGSPMVHIKTCESHELPIDIICEDCDKFICGKCAKTDHRDHDWNTIPTAATQRRRGWQEFLKKIKEEDLPGINEMMEKIPRQITENKEMCDSEIKRIQTHFDEIMAELTKFKKLQEKKLKDDLVKKTDQLNLIKSELEKKKRGIVDTVEFIEENNSTMSDYSLIYNHRELTKFLSELEVNMTNCEQKVRFNRGEINDNLLISLFGKALDLSAIGLTQINSFRYGVRDIRFLETISGEQCYIKEFGSQFIEKINQQGRNEYNISITANDLCVTDTGDVYFTDFSNLSISCLSPSGSVSIVIIPDPLIPGGICQSVDSGLLVTLREKDSDLYELEPHSRRLVRHITVRGDIIHKYEYHEDGQTKLFTFPYKVTQSSNSDICVVNRTSLYTGELVIMSPSGHMMLVYHGQNLAKNFNPTDVVCDSLCNILVIDQYNNHIHLLSPDGEFLKFLLTENEVSRPYTLSLYKSTLWVGYTEGLVRVFQYRM